MAGYICTLCGYQGSPKTVVKGSFIIEIFLWFFFIIPGLLYSIWRASNKSKVCRHCGNSGVIPINSPKGSQLLSEISVARNDNPATTGSVEYEQPNFTQRRSTAVAVILLLFALAFFINTISPKPTTTNTIAQQPPTPVSSTLPIETINPEPKGGLGLTRKELVESIRKGKPEFVFKQGMSSTGKENYVAQSDGNIIQLRGTKEELEEINIVGLFSDSVNNNIQSVAFIGGVANVIDEEAGSWVTDTLTKYARSFLDGLVTGQAKKINGRVYKLSSITVDGYNGVALAITPEH